MPGQEQDVVEALAYGGVEEVVEEYTVAVDGHQRLGRVLRQRTQARAPAADQNDQLI